MTAKRMFDTAALEASVRTALADAPEDHRGAFLTIANQDGVRAVIAARIRGDWTISAVVEHEFESKDTRFGVTVQGTF